MTESEYNQLCASCDWVLSKRPNKKSRVSVPWLHPLKEHPVILEEYEEIFNQNNSLKKTIKTYKRVLRYVGGWIRQIIVSLFKNETKDFFDEKITKKIDFLFVSHLLSEADLIKKNDFYFGDIPDQLAQKGFNVGVILLNHTGKSHDKLRYQGGNYFKVVLPDALPFFDEVKNLLVLLFELVQLIGESKSDDEAIIKKIYMRAAQETLSSGAARAMRIHKQIIQIAEKLQPENCLITYEGHSWERLVFSGLREGYPQVKCTAYQHVPLTKRQHALARKLSPQFNPDHIFTIGESSYNFLINKLSLSSDQISILGSQKYINLDAINLLENHKKKCCLVLPEGLESECIKLFKFSVECAKKIPKIKFIWRLHPLISFEYLKSKYAEFDKLPSNIELSEEAFEVDLNRANIALYRGSSTIIQAVIFNMLPIYLNIKNELTIDPLHQVNNNFIVENESDFSALVDKSRWEINRLSIIKNYCANFYSPINYSLLNTIKNKNIK